MFKLKMREEALEIERKLSLLGDVRLFLENLTADDFDHIVNSLQNLKQGITNEDILHILVKTSSYSGLSEEAKRGFSANEHINALVSSMLKRPHEAVKTIRFTERVLGDEYNELSRQISKGGMLYLYSSEGVREVGLLDAKHPTRDGFLPETQEDIDRKAEIKKLEERLKYLRGK